MPAISFQHEFLDALLSGSKRQTTRKQTVRIKVGDVCHIYNQQRRRIIDKPMRKLTEYGHAAVCSTYAGSFYRDSYHAHFLGIVKITEVYDMCPCDNSARSAWAKADGFTNFGVADKWFTARYGEDWYLQMWTVIQWDGWLERYFMPER
jgi:hypothetical protein